MRVIRASETSSKALGDRGRSLRILPADAGYPALELYLNTLAPGSGPGPFHYHSNAENIYVVMSGNAEVTVGTERVRLTASDTIVVSRGEPHDIECHGSDPLRIIEIKVPAGSDFVEVADHRRGESGE